MIEKSIFKKLSEDEDVKEIVGTKVFPQVSYEPAPCVVYSRTSTPHRSYSHEGNAGLTTAVIELACWGGEGPEGYDVAKELAEVVRLCLDGFQGVVGGQEITKILLDEERDDLVDVGPDVVIHGVILDVRVQFREVTN